MDKINKTINATCKMKLPFILENNINVGNKIQNRRR